MKKSFIIMSILILIVLVSIWAFLSLGRAGGEIGFEAQVIRIEEGWLMQRSPKMMPVSLQKAPGYDCDLSRRVSGL